MKSTIQPSRLKFYSIAVVVAILFKHICHLAPKNPWKSRTNHLIFSGGPVRTFWTTHKIFRSGGPPPTMGPGTPYMPHLGVLSAIVGGASRPKNCFWEVQKVLTGPPEKSSGRTQAQYTQGIPKQSVYPSLGCPKTQGIAKPRASTCLGCTQAQGVPKSRAFPSPGRPHAQCVPKPMVSPSSVRTQA